jgi:multidrug efflux pump subunit AcrB
MSSLNDIKNTPVASSISAGQNPVPGLLSNVASLKRDSIQTNANQANIQPVYEVYANAEGRDLGSISSDISKIVSEYQKQMSPGNRIEVTGPLLRPVKGLSTIASKIAVSVGGSSFCMASSVKTRRQGAKGRLLNEVARYS